MLTYPDLSPIIVNIGPIAIRWYGLMYVLSVLLGLALLKYRLRNNQVWDFDKISDLAAYVVIGIILGGRMGYAIFYTPQVLLEAPLEILKIWHPGMSFHGGIIGVISLVCIYSYKRKTSAVAVFDLFTPLIPLGIFLGRIGNFINAELWGKVSDVSWAMVFPYAGPLPRHPSQLYEAILEGLLLFIILWWYSAKPRKKGMVSGLFLLGYAIARFIAEFYREPDPQYGYIVFGWMTMGQILSLPILLLAVVVLIIAKENNTKEYIN